jgi:hypothetical protein
MALVNSRSLRFHDIAFAGILLHAALFRTWIAGWFCKRINVHAQQLSDFDLLNFIV